MSISSYRGPTLGNLGEGSSTGDFEMDEGARWMNCLPLPRGSVEGTWGGVPSLGTLEDTFGRSPDAGNSLYGGPSVIWGTRGGGGSYAGDFGE